MSSRLSPLVLLCRRVQAAVGLGELRTAPVRALGCDSLADCMYSCADMRYALVPTFQVVRLLAGLRYSWILAVSHAVSSR